MNELMKGARVDVPAGRYTVALDSASDGLVDAAAVLLAVSGRVRSDDDFVFFNQPVGPGVEISAGHVVEVDLNRVPADISRVLITGSTEAQGVSFGAVMGLSIRVSGSSSFVFCPEALTTETVLQTVAFYRRGDGWRIDAIGQGYQDGLAAFATDHGISVDEPELVESPASPAPAPAPSAGSPVSMEKVRISMTKESASRTATIDLRKSQGDPDWVLTVGLEWDGRGAKYGKSGKVTSYGTGDLDVYFFVRNEQTNDYVVISGDPGRHGSLDAWPNVKHFGDSKGPGRGKPAVEQVQVLPQENGQMAVSVYQSVDNGLGALNTFGNPRVAVRYGRRGRKGLPGPDADEILVHVGNNKNAFWATIAMIDVENGILTVEGETQYSRAFSEAMPGIDSNGKWVRAPKGGPRGQSKKRNKGQGLSHYRGRCV
ncbi:TerD family protein [Gordonia sp. TBRC 11910]|uniref:TerD family protein n=1 Tax=Gordonia asplenii TaxID=2725283 RepID=A0A848L6L6_9ACTN|nr:TerD family protein [Gordonia asplenii]NMO03248.1 TerD family protein [Gordonia asplenii]